MKIGTNGSKWWHRGALVAVGVMGLLVTACSSSEVAEVAEATEVAEVAEIAEAGALVMEGRRAVQTKCGNGLDGIDGLFEYAPVDGEMVRLDLTTLETTTHGSIVGECAFWFGDGPTGRRVAIPQEGDRVWFGPLEGEWETEVKTGGDWGLLSRSFAANRLLFLDFTTFSLRVVDATTGERVGEPIVGSFERGRGSAANAVSGDGSLLAVGGANPAAANGVVILVDAVSGDRLFDVEVPGAVTTMVFDDNANELIVGSFTGEVVTIDLASHEIVSEVSNSTGVKIMAIGIRDDGLVLTLSSRLIELIDREAGPTGSEITVPSSVVAGRIRPDGSILTLGGDDISFAVYAFDQ